jgi:dethiobiotin synthetase
MLGLPVIVVARAGLGTINHTLLTVEAVSREQQTVAAVVLNARSDEDRAFVGENASEIQRRFQGRVLTLWQDSPVLDELLT